MDPSTIACAKCHGKTFSRIAYAHEGSVLEMFCPTDGWSKPVVISLHDRPPVTPSGPEEWRDQIRHEIGVAGGLARAKQTKGKALPKGMKRRGRKVGSRVGAYKQRVHTKPAWWQQKFRENVNYEQ